MIYVLFGHILLDFRTKSYDTIWWPINYIHFTFVNIFCLSCQFAVAFPFEVRYPFPSVDLKCHQRNVYSLLAWLGWMAKCRVNQWMKVKICCCCCCYFCTLIVGQIKEHRVLPRLVMRGIWLCIALSTYSHRPALRKVTDRRAACKSFMQNKWNSSPCEL